MLIIKFSLLNNYKNKPKAKLLIESKRTIDNLDIITGFYSKQLNSGVSAILRVVDKIGMKSQRDTKYLFKFWL